MEQKTKNRIIIIISAIIIIAGIAIAITKGFNFELKYENSNKIELNLGQEFNNEDIKVVAEEQLNGQKVIIQKVEEFADTVSIVTKSISEEQKNNIVTKVNEKYETEIDAEKIEITPVQHVRGRDLIKPYIKPFSIATILILVYMAFRYNKIGVLKTIIKTIIILALTQLILFSIMAITRIPVGRLTIPLVIIVYVTSLIAIATDFEKKLQSVKNEDKE